MIVLKRRVLQILAFGFMAVIVLQACGSSGSDSRAAASTNQGGLSRGSDEDRRGLNTLPPGMEPLDKGRAVQWKVARILGDNELQIMSAAGWCPDIPHSYPRIIGVKEIDRAHAVILTAYLTGGIQRGCAEVATDAFRVVRLRQPLRGRPLYDGSQSPPKKRWPREKAGT